MGIMPIPVLSKIPVIGSIFFQQSPLVYGAYLLVAVTAVFLNRTKAGLNFKAVGEFPKAAETLGINVVSRNTLPASYAVPWPVSAVHI